MMRLNFAGKSLDEIAIERLRAFEAEACEMNPDGYYLAYSGGKDSDVILHLAKRSGVKFTAHHNLTTCDPPECVYHVQTHPEVEIHKPAESMWQLIRRKKMPPRRMARYCCEVLKERGGESSLVVTGIRWGESGRRSKRQMVEACYRTKGKKYLHPIIDWSTADVWQYIRDNGVVACSLYAEGWKRVGCVLCPMIRQTQKQIERWPKIGKAWERAVKGTFDPDKKLAGGRLFTTPQEYWEWWLDRDAPSRKSSSPVLFEDDPELFENSLASNKGGE